MAIDRGNKAEGNHTTIICGNHSAIGDNNVGDISLLFLSEVVEKEHAVALCEGIGWAFPKFILLIFLLEDTILKIELEDIAFGGPSVESSPFIVEFESSDGHSTVMHFGVQFI